MMTRCRSVLFSFGLLVSAASVFAQDPLVGHADEALMRTIREHYRPQLLVDPATAITIDTYHEGGNTPMIHSYLRGADRNLGDVADDLLPFNVSRPSWWSYSNDFGDTLRVDLHNIFTVEASDLNALQAEVPTFAPGHAEASVGGDYGTLRFPVPGDESTLTSCYTPPLRWRGDFARAIFYMATLYPTGMWHIDCRLILDRRSFPFFSDYGVATLLSWHRADPPDDVELRRMRAVSALQGNVNPFVERPELVEYLWGDRSGQTVLPPASDPDDPDADDEPSNLRGVYYRSIDRSVYLISPYVASDASWSIDGAAVEDAKIPLTSLSDGRHELSFECPDGTRGRILIEILP